MRHAMEEGRIHRRVNLHQFTATVMQHAQYSKKINKEKEECAGRFHGIVPAPSSTPIGVYVWRDSKNYVLSIQALSPEMMVHIIKRVTCLLLIQTLKIINKQA